MSDGPSRPPTPRPRPDYGLPGPAGQGAPAAPDPAPWQSSPPPAPQHDVATGLPGGAPDPAPRPRRRGVWTLVIGLVLLVLIGPAMAIGGIVWSVGSIAGDAQSGPIELSGGSGVVELGANEMLMVYVPAEDAEATTCTAEGADSGAVSTVPTSGRTQFGDGSQYEQVLGVAALENTAVTITCEGTQAPAYLGPFSLFGVAAPLLIGVIVGVVLGLVGLILVIIGTVRLVRSRRT